MNKLTVFGPPGTGKTTYLMQLLERELITTRADRIAFVSFTRQGTYEGVSRAVDKFNLSKDDTIFFKTIHSLCFHNIGVSKSMMISKNHYKLLSDTTGISFTGYYTEDLSSSNDAYLHAIAMNKHNPEFADKLYHKLNAKTMAYIKVQYQAMKEQVGILDFDDLLLNYLDYGTSLDIDTAFIDEAQDLTPLQWKVIKKLFKNAKQIYVAGDDDQAVYEWSGANVYEFLEFSNKHTILDKSYRLPSKVLSLAKRVTKDITHRKPKEFSPKDSKGTVDISDGLHRLGLKGGELILARTNWILRGLTTDFDHMGIPYTIKGRPSIANNIINAINTHIAYEKGLIEIDKLRKFKTLFSTLDRQPWQRVIELRPEQVAHYDSVIRNENTQREPVKFETYHSCKGSENDHVIMSTELSKKVHTNMYNNYDSELRCLYVAMTRTKDKLTLLTPRTELFYPNKYFN